MEKSKAAIIHSSTLAYMGDAVYELAIRTMLVEDKPDNVHKVHKKAIKYVSSEGQAKAAREMLASGFISEEEERVLKRARNHRTTSMPKNAEVKTYKLATGFEALIGYLHMSEQQERLQEVINEAIRIINGE